MLSCRCTLRAADSPLESLVTIVVCSDSFRVKLVPTPNLEVHGECQMQITSDSIHLFDIYDPSKCLVTWPLNSLRKYGRDKSRFTFEAGRSVVAVVSEKIAWAKLLKYPSSPETLLREYFASPNCCFVLWYQSFSSAGGTVSFDRFCPTGEGMFIFRTNEGEKIHSLVHQATLAIAAIHKTTSVWPLNVALTKTLFCWF